MEQGVAAEWLVGRYTEIMPGRPTISHHRYPKDNVRRSIDAKNSDVQTVLNTMIITAAEQQTMNYYMNVTNFACSDMGRKLYQEIALVEEEHVTQYESLMDPNATWLEMLLWHEYCECYLYWSCYMTETDGYVKKLWEENLAMEISHLHKAAELLKKYEGKEWQEVIKDGTFPEPISLHENIDYVRKILGETVQYTSLKEKYVRVKDLPSDADFFRFQKITNPTPQIVPSHCTIETFIRRRGADYRYQVAPSPVPELRNRREDNTTVGRKPNAANSSDFTCND
jgi:rubrerythrin